MLAAVLLTLQHEGLYHCTTVAAAAAAVVASFLLFIVFLPLFFYYICFSLQEKGNCPWLWPRGGRRSSSISKLFLSLSLNISLWFKVPSHYLSLSLVPRYALKRSLIFLHKYNEQCITVHPARNATRWEETTKQNKKEQEPSLLPFLVFVSRWEYGRQTRETDSSWEERRRNQVVC